MLHNEYRGKICSRELSDASMLRQEQGNVAKKQFFGDKTNRVMIIKHLEHKAFPAIDRQKHEKKFPAIDFTGIVSKIEELQSRFRSI